MRSRLDLHNKLLEILGNCYFQPPESVKLKYPCIVYSLDNIDTRYADDSRYKNTKRYTLTLIERDPDTDYTEQILEKFEYCRHDRRYISDNLVHDAFSLYY